VGPSGEKKSKMESKALEGIEWKWYESKEGGFKVKYPADWEEKGEWEEDRIKGCYVVGISCRVDEGRIGVGIAVTTEDNKPSYLTKPISEYTPYEILMRSLGSSYESENWSTEIEEVKNISLDGKPAAKVVYIEEAEGFELGDFKLNPRYGKLIDIESIYKGKIFGILLSTENNNPTASKSNYSLWEENLPIFEEMIDSFEFLWFT
jgi:nitrate reductase beta subunit